VGGDAALARAINMPVALHEKVAHNAHQATKPGGTVSAVWREWMSAYRQQRHHQASSTRSAHCTDSNKKRAQKRMISCPNISIRRGITARRCPGRGCISIASIEQASQAAGMVVGRGQTANAPSAGGGKSVARR